MGFGFQTQTRNPIFFEFSCMNFSDEQAGNVTKPTPNFELELEMRI